MARAAAAADAWDRRQHMLDAPATKRSETRSCTGSRPRCSSGQSQSPKASAAATRFARRWAGTSARRPGRCGRSQGYTRWWAASSSPGSFSPRQYEIFKELGQTLILLGFGSRRDRRNLAGDPAAAEEAPARGLRRAREDGRQSVPLDHGRVLGQAALRARAGGGRRTAARRSAKSSPPGRPRHAGRLAQRPREGCWPGNTGSRRPKSSRRRR